MRGCYINTEDVTPGAWVVIWRAMPPPPRSAAYPKWMREHINLMALLHPAPVEDPQCSAVAANV